MSKRLIALVLGVLAVASMVAAGCGGGDDDEATASSITKAEFVKKANAACEKYREKVVEDFVRYSEEGKFKEPSKAEYTKVLSIILIPNVEKEIEEIRALGAPDGDEEQIDAFLAGLEEAITIAEAKPEEVTANSDIAFKKPNQLAKEYGLKGCDSR